MYLSGEINLSMFIHFYMNVNNKISYLLVLTRLGPHATVAQQIMYYVQSYQTYAVPVSTRIDNQITRICWHNVSTLFACVHMRGYMIKVYVRKHPGMLDLCPKRN